MEDQIIIKTAEMDLVPTERGVEEGGGEGVLSLETSKAIFKNLISSHNSAHNFLN